MPQSFFLGAKAAWSDTNAAQLAVRLFSVLDLTTHIADAINLGKQATIRPIVLVAKNPVTGNFKVWSKRIHSWSLRFGALHSVPTCHITPCQHWI
jgi:hypothetical protein